MPVATQAAVLTMTPIPATATETAVPPTVTPTNSPSPTASPTATLVPTATPEIPVRFAVIGDYGLAGTFEADVATLVKSWNPDFIITVGDNNYPDGSPATIDQNIGQYYHDYIYPYVGSYGPGASTNRFFPTIGNHDCYTVGCQAYLDYFTLPGNERYYDFVKGPVHFFALNSEPTEPDGFRRDSLQAAWLQEQMAASTATWRLVYFHDAPYTSGYQGNTVWMQWPFTEWGADAVLTGHDHDYERLWIGSTPYIVNGLGGGGIYDFSSALPESQVRFNDDWGAMRVTADSKTITFEFFTRKGDLVDSLTLYKKP